MSEKRSAFASDSGRSSSPPAETERPRQSSPPRTISASLAVRMTEWMADYRAGKDMGFSSFDEFRKERNAQMKRG